MLTGASCLSGRQFRGTMSIARALPYLLLALVLAAAGYLAGAVTDPFAPTRSSVRGELSPQEPRLRRDLEQARGEAAELTGELQRAQTTIDRLRADLTETRARIAELQQRAEAAEAARAAAQNRIGELAERVAALEARADVSAASSSADAGNPAAAQAEAQQDTQEDTGGSGPSDGDRTADAGERSAASPNADASPDATAVPASQADDADRPATDAATGNVATGNAATGDATTGNAGAQTASEESGPDRSAPATDAPAQDTAGPRDGATDSAGQSASANADTAANPAGAEGSPARAAAAEPPSAGPPDLEADPRPSAGALSAISPTTRQANRLVAGVEAYQDAEYQQAFRAWLPLAKAGYARAQLHLGALFLEGRGAERNDPLAYAWLTIARDNGSQNAGPLLQQLRARMNAAEMDAARQLLTRARNAGS